MTLDESSLNKWVVINNIKGENNLKRRLLDLGFIPNGKVLPILISPFKDPKAYLINDNVIALRNIDAKKIEVSYERN